MRMNVTKTDYKKSIVRQFYYGALAVKDVSGNTHHFRFWTLQKMKDAMKTLTDANVIGGTVNGHSIKALFSSIPCPVGTFMDKLDKILQTEKALPDLYVTGGYYMQKDNSLLFQLSRPSSGDPVYIYGKRPWTDLPVYQIEKDRLVKVKSGEIPSPNTVFIDHDLDQQIRTALKEREIMFL